MNARDIWSQSRFALPPESLPDLSRCIEALFGWAPVKRNEELLAYRVLRRPSESGVISFHASATASKLASILRRQRAMNPELDAAFFDWDLEPEAQDAVSFVVDGVESWEQRLEAIRRAEQEHPEWQVRVLDVARPGDEHARTAVLYHARVRVGILGALRNRIEMQCLVEQPPL